MKRLMIIMMLVSAVFVLGCTKKAETNNAEVTTVSEITTEAQTQMRMEATTELPGVENTPYGKAFVIGDKMLEHHEGGTKVFNDNSAVEDGKTVMWKYNQTEAVLTLTGESGDNTNCKLSYSSEAGKFDNLELQINTKEKKHLDMKFYEADINYDVAKDLIVVYNQGGALDNVMIYDFKNGKKINPVGDGAGIFSKEQREYILGRLKGWYEQGYIEVKTANSDTFEDLKYDTFKPEVVMIDGTHYIRIAVWDASSTAEYKDKLFVRLAYKDGAYAIDMIEEKVVPKKINL